MVLGEIQRYTAKEWVQFSHSVVSNSLQPHESQHARPPCPELPEFTQTHVHRVGDAIQPSHPLSSSSPRWTQILDTVLSAAATNGLVVSCQATPLCHASDFRDRKTEDQRVKIIHLRSYMANWYLGWTSRYSEISRCLGNCLFFHLISLGSYGHN